MPENKMIKEGLTYDDVLLVPKFSDIKSRSEIDLTVKMGDLTFLHPIIPANMKTVTGRDMAMEVAISRGLAILHRFMPLQEQLDIAEDMIDVHGFAKNFAVSVGVKKEDKEAIHNFYEVGARIFCIDIAHGDSGHCLDMISWIKTNYPETFVIAGNIATKEAAIRLWNVGADAVKVGVGPGSLCTTRIETGNGVPQLTALMDVFEAREELRCSREVLSNNFYIIADGGIKAAGDIVKALCFSDMVMAGNVFAGCEETPGRILSVDGKSYKEYAGSSAHKSTHIEGVSAIVHTKGKYKDVLSKLLQGLRSGCSYQGVEHVRELQENPEFVRISSAGLRESHPHDVTIK